MATYFCSKHHAGANEQTESFGVLPHQIRGHLSTFKNTIIQGEAYEQCTACSKAIIDKYRAEDVDFIINACNDTSLLEATSGLQAMKESMEKMMNDLDDMGDDEFGDDDDAVLL